jgi:hypothetical protein
MKINAAFIPQKHQLEETNKYLEKIVRDYYRIKMRFQLLKQNIDHKNAVQI